MQENEVPSIDSKKKYPTNFNVYRLRNDLMQFNNNQECEFNTNLLCMLLLLSPPTPFYCKNCRTFLFTNISLQTYHPLLLGLPAPGSKKNLADILKFIFNLKCEIWGNCQYFVFEITWVRVSFQSFILIL